MGDSNCWVTVSIDSDKEIYRPTADLAVFDIALIDDGAVNQNVDGFAAVRTVYAVVLDAFQRCSPACVAFFTNIPAYSMLLRTEMTLLLHRSRYFVVIEQANLRAESILTALSQYLR